jgi:hypothetical protein
MTRAIDKDLWRELTSTLPKVPDIVSEYYAMQEADVRPSRFLRAKLQEVQCHGDYRGCFESPKLVI